MATGFSTWASEAFAVLQKDLRAEFRTRTALNAIGLFAVMTLMAVSFAVGPAGLNEDLQAALLWVIIFFSAMSGLSRTFVHEEETRTVHALKLAAAPNVVLMGKLAFNLVLLGLLEVIVVPLFVLLLGVKIGNVPLFVGVLVSGSLGLSIVATLLAAMVAQVSARGTLFAVLSFPVLVPLLMMAMRTTAEALRGGGELWALGGLVSYAGVMGVVSWFLFEVIWSG
jgi:heme exporter protein B